MFDQLAERYLFGWKCYHSWMYIFNWLINAAIVNSYILFQKSSTGVRKKKYAQIDYRVELAKSLINNYSGRQLQAPVKPHYISPQAPENFISHMNIHMNVARVKTCRGHRKFEGKTKKTIYGCTACNVFLCKTCHPEWHATGNN